MERLLALLLLYPPSVILGAEPPTAPILRIEAGMHTATINRIATDKPGRLVLTASDDKTARLWKVEGAGSPLNMNIQGLKPLPPPLRTFRIPIGEGDEGMLYACALSPDGALAAVGGWCRAGYIGSEMNNNIYLFDTATGLLLRRLEGLPDVILDLAFSQQGRFLAAGLGEGKGLRVWETVSWCEVGRDTTYGESNSYGVDWHGEDRLVTTCDDGKLRLYHVAQASPPVGVPGVPPGNTSSDTDSQNGCLTFLKQALVQGGKEPFSARFSPDGQRIAVGFSDSTAVTVVDGSDLSFLFSPDTRGVNRGNLSKVTWSDDGVSLAAGGKWAKQFDNVLYFPIRLWQQSGQGEPQDIASAANTIMDLRPLPSGGILFGATDPAWGVVASRRASDGGGTTPLLGSTLLGAPPLADYRGLLEHFRVTADGIEVDFGYEYGGKTHARFSLSERELTQGEASSRRQSFPESAGTSPLLEGLKISDWKTTTTPTLNGQPLALERYERSRSLAIARDASFFLLGTSWYFRSFNAQGTERWKVPVPGTVWAVNLAARDQLAVAAYADGTIRWHRADNGKELLAFFPHTDRKRWVLWTPQGYYDCSPGGEDLIGWHMNYGKNQAADFFPASRFRAIYYRPDVIQRILKTRDFTQAVRQANEALGRPDDPPASVANIIATLSPPVVEIETGGVLSEVMLPSETQSFDLSYRVRQTSTEMTQNVEIRANGRPLGIKAPLPTKNDTASVSVPLPADFEGEIAIIASHALARSMPATLRVRRSSPPAALRTPKMFVLSIGAAELAMNQQLLLAANANGLQAKDRFQNLEFAADDARKVAALFAQQPGQRFQSVVAQVLLNEQATTDGLRQAIKDIGAKAELGDVVFVFFSGHGNHDPKTGKFHLVTHDTDPKREAETAFSGEELSQLLGQVRGYVVVALDACHSGAVLGMQQGEKYKAPPLDISGLANQLSSAEHGIVVLSSSTPDQVSFEDRELGGGLFTKALLEGLEGKAANQGAITCKGLMQWIDKRLPELTTEGADPVHSQTAITQTPVSVMPQGVPDFVLSRTH